MKTRAFAQYPDTRPAEVALYTTEGWAASASRPRSGAASRCEGPCELRNHLARPVVQHLLKPALRRVTDSRTPMSLFYCCDAPGVRRYMCLDATPAGDDCVQLRAVTMIEQEMASPAEPPTEPGPDDFLRMCSWCGSVQLGGWVEAGEALQRLRLLEHRTEPQISHTICQTCKERIGAEYRSRQGAPPKE